MFNIYGIIIRFYYFLILSASVSHWKAKKYIQGRIRWKERIKAQINPNVKKIWICCPSIGEFQECKKFVNQLTSKKNNYQFIFTFHSPSGYDQAKIPECDHIRLMLPLDTKKNARCFLDLIDPHEMYILATGIWPNYTRELQKRTIPHYWISFYSRKSNSFYKPILKTFYRPLFSSFEYIFCYNEDGKKLLKNHFGYERAIPIGNLRVDSVLEMRETQREIEGIESFTDNTFCIVAGSTEKKENKLLIKAFKNLKYLPIKWIIVPHEKRKRTLNKLERNLGDNMCFYSKELDPKKQVLVYDITGDLFQLYFHSDLCLVGRGFHRYEIHNMLEPAVLLKPVLIGPKHKMFIEPKLFIKKKFAFEFNNANELSALIEGIYTKNIIVNKYQIQETFDTLSGGTDLVMSTILSSH